MSWASAASTSASAQKGDAAAAAVACAGAPPAQKALRAVRFTDAQRAAAGACDEEDAPVSGKRGPPLGVTRVLGKGQVLAVRDEDLVEAGKRYSAGSAIPTTDIRSVSPPAFAHVDRVLDQLDDDEPVPKRHEHVGLVEIDIPEDVGPLSENRSPVPARRDET